MTAGGQTTKEKKGGEAAWKKRMGEKRKAEAETQPRDEILM